MEKTQKPQIFSRIRKLEDRLKTLEDKIEDLATTLDAQNHNIGVLQKTAVEAIAKLNHDVKLLTVAAHFHGEQSVIDKLRNEFSIEMPPQDPQPTDQSTEPSTPETTTVDASQDESDAK